MFQITDQSGIKNKLRSQTKQISFNRINCMHGAILIEYHESFGQIWAMHATSPSTLPLRSIMKVLLGLSTETKIKSDPYIIYRGISNAKGIEVCPNKISNIMLKCLVTFIHKNGGKVSDLSRS